MWWCGSPKQDPGHGRCKVLLPHVNLETPKSRGSPCRSGNNLLYPSEIQFHFSHSPISLWLNKTDSLTERGNLRRDDHTRTTPGQDEGRDDSGPCVCHKDQNWQPVPRSHGECWYRLPVTALRRNQGQTHWSVCWLVELGGDTFLYLLHRASGDWLELPSEMNTGTGYSLATLTWVFPFLTLDSFSPMVSVYWILLAGAEAAAVNQETLHREKDAH